jgi:hypothetical protein
MGSLRTWQQWAIAQWPHGRSRLRWIVTRSIVGTRCVPTTASRSRLPVTGPGSHPLDVETDNAMAARRVRSMSQSWPYCNPRHSRHIDESRRRRRCHLRIRGIRYLQILLATRLAWSDLRPHGRCDGLAEQVPLADVPPQYRHRLVAAWLRNLRLLDPRSGRPQPGP